MYTQIIIKKNLLFFLTVYKNERREHKLWQKNTKKSDFYNKITKKKKIKIDNIDVNKISVFKKETDDKYNSFKYFIGYNDNDVIRQLYLGLP